MTVTIINQDALTALKALPSESVQVCITSPPYAFLRSYLPADHPDKAHEIGSEPTPDAYVAALVEVFREVRRVLRRDGVLVLNLGDSMSGSGKGASKSLNGRNSHSIGIRSGECHGLPPKNLLMIPFRVAMALQADGWILRSVMPWLKRSSMPESVTDRPASSIEYLFLLARSQRYFWDAEAIRVPNVSADDPRNRPDYSAKRERNVGGREDGYTSAHGAIGWNAAGRSYRNSDPFFATWQGLMLDEAGAPLALVVNPRPSRLSHYAAFPASLVAPFVKAGTSERGACPQCGAGWVRAVERHDIPSPGKMGCHHSAGLETSADLWPSGTPPQSGLRRDVWQRSQTTGWQPSCLCSPVQPPRPCVVLDCFGGSGTTGLVADRLGRDAILIELSPEYCRMAEKRIAEDAPMLTDVAVQAASVQPELFGERAG